MRRLAMIVVGLAMLVGVARAQEVVVKEPAAANVLAIPVVKRVTVPARTSVKMRILRRTVNYSRKFVQIKYETITEDGKGVATGSLTLRDSPAVLDADGNIVTPAVTAYTDYIGSKLLPELRDAEALAAAGKI